MSDTSEESELVGYDISLRVELWVPKGKAPPTDYDVGTAIVHELDCIPWDTHLGFNVETVMY